MQYNICHKTGLILCEIIFFPHWSDYLRESARIILTFRKLCGKKKVFTFSCEDYLLI